LLGVAPVEHSIACSSYSTGFHQFALTEAAWSAGGDDIDAMIPAVTGAQFSGSQGPLATQYLQSITSHIVNTTSTLSGDPPVAIILNAWHTSIVPDGAAFLLFRVLQQHLREAIQLASDGRFAAKYVYVNDHLVKALFDNTTERTKRVAAFREKIVELFQIFDTASRHVVDRQRKCLLLAPQQPAAAVPTAAAATSQPPAAATAPASTGSDTLYKSLSM
jgi:hypothetical protein